MEDNAITPHIKEPVQIHEKKFFQNIAMGQIRLEMSFSDTSDLLRQIQLILASTSQTTDRQKSACACLGLSLHGLKIIANEQPDEKLLLRFLKQVSAAMTSINVVDAPNEAISTFLIAADIVSRIKISESVMSTDTYTKYVAHWLQSVAQFALKLKSAANINSEILPNICSCMMNALDPKKATVIERMNHEDRVKLLAYLYNGITGLISKVDACHSFQPISVRLRAKTIEAYFLSKVPSAKLIESVSHIIPGSILSVEAT